LTTKSNLSLSTLGCCPNIVFAILSCWTTLPELFGGTIFPDVDPICTFIYCGTATWIAKLFNGTGVAFIVVAFIIVTFGIPGCFINANWIFTPPFSNAVIGGNDPPPDPYEPTFDGCNPPDPYEPAFDGWGVFELPIRSNKLPPVLGVLFDDPYAAGADGSADDGVERRSKRPPPPVLFGWFTVGCDDGWFTLPPNISDKRSLLFGCGVLFVRDKSSCVCTGFDFCVLRCLASSSSTDDAGDLLSWPGVDGALSSS